MVDKIKSTGITFDDVLLVPGYSDFSRADISLKTRISKRISIDIPFTSAPMDTVTESTLSIALGSVGGLGIIHRNLSVENQAKEVEKVKKLKLKVGAAIGTSKGFEDRVKALINAGADLIALDSAHGFTSSLIKALKFIKKQYPKVDVMAGDIATSDVARALILAGADSLRVGMGPGAICTTRIVSGMGIPQITAILETSRAAAKSGVPVIADGGIKFSGDITKALAAGASACMMGSFFASCEEAPGQTYRLSPAQIPARFKSIIGKNPKATYLFKSYRGMGSVGAMKKGEKIKSEDEYHGKNYSDRVLVAEGVEGLVPVKGSVKQVIEQAIGGITSGMYYVGVRSILELQKKSSFIQITHASLTESHPHNILVTNPGENYV